MNIPPNDCVMGCSDGERAVCSDVENTGVGCAAMGNSIFPERNEDVGSCGIRRIKVRGIFRCRMNPHLNILLFPKRERRKRRSEAESFERSEEGISESEEKRDACLNIRGHGLPIEACATSVCEIQGTECALLRAIARSDSLRSSSEIYIIVFDKYTFQ